MGILEYTFFQHAIILLVLTSIVSGVIGTLIVVKKISMTSGSIAHGAFGGLGIAYFLGLPPIFGALAFSLLGSAIISFVYRWYKNYLDTILTIFWASGMAVGIVFVYLTPGYSSDLFSYLFGNVLLSSSTDLIFMGVMSVIVTISVFVLYETLIAVLFNEEFAMLKGIRVTAIFTFFLVLIALSVVSLIKSVGIVLTLAMFTISPAIAVRYLKKVDQIIFMSVLINLATSLCGLFIAYVINLPTAPTVIILQAALFAFSLFFKKAST